MAFDALNYNTRSPYAVTEIGDLSETFTTADMIKKYTPGQMVQIWDQLFGFRVFKLVKNLNGNTIAQGDLMSFKDTASVGTITAGTTTSITTSGLTANDLEYQMIICGDDAGATGAAPEGEASLCTANSATVITLHPDYAFSAAIAADDTAAVCYVNAVNDAAASDERGYGLGTLATAGIAYGAAADNYWFWLLQKGWCSAKNTDALAVQELIAGTALIQDAAEGAQELVIGQCPLAQFAGTETSFATVYINCLDTITITGTP